MSKDRGQLLACQPDGRCALVPCTYEGIKEGLNGATLDFVRGRGAGFYVDDNGMIDELPLNVPASLMMGMVLYGPVVLCAPFPDEEGDTLPPTEEVAQVLAGMADQWSIVVADAARKGQSVVFPTANANTIPPPQVIGMSQEEFDRFLLTGETPT
jgi:hypothetical protein